MAGNCYRHGAIVVYSGKHCPVCLAERDHQPGMQDRLRRGREEHHRRFMERYENRPHWPETVMLCAAAAVAFIVFTMVMT